MILWRGEGVSFRWLRPAVLVLLAGVLYLPFLSNPLIFDDLGLFGPIGSNAELGTVFNLRGLPYFTFGATWVFFGESIPVYRVQNLLLHCLNTWLVWRLLILWGELFLKDAGHRARFSAGAFGAAAIFAVHPLAVYGAGYLVQRSILMATLFTLLMQLAYLRGITEHNKRYLVLAVLAYLFSVFSKEHSLMAPAILLPLTWLLRERNEHSLRVLSFTWLGFFFVALLVVLRIKGILGQPYEFDATSLFLKLALPADVQQLHLLSVLTQSGLFFKYAFLMLIPNPAWMSIDMREVFMLTWKEWASWVGLTAFVAYGVLALRSLLKGGRLGLLGLALLYPWCHFMVEFSSVRVQEVFVLYRAYLWLPGYMLIFALLLSALSVRRQAILCSLAVLVMIPLAWNRLQVFSEEFRVWDDAARLLHGEDRLGSARIYYGRARASAANKNWESAIEDYKKSLSIDPTKTQTTMALSSAYFGAGRYSDALAEVDRVIETDPDNPKAHYNKGVIYKKLGDTRAAEEIQRSCDLGAVVACATVVFTNIKKQHIDPMKK